MNKIAVSLMAVSAAAGLANAQFGTYPIEGQLQFQVWDGAAWVSSVNALAGEQVEFRAVVNYVGGNAGVTSLGELLYSPVFSNADNSGAGAGQDRIADLIRDSGFGVAGSLLNQADGASGAARPVSGTNTDNIGYGRVNFGQTGMTGATTGLTAFRHTGFNPNGASDGDGAGGNGYGSGDYIRLAGASVSNWPVYPMSSAQATAANINNFKRSVSANQLSANSIGTNHTPGRTGLIVFRGAIIISDDVNLRTMTISSDVAFAQRIGGAGSGDDTRYMTWQVGANDNGSYRTGVEFHDATININVPTPASMALMGLGGLMVARRRRA